MELGAFQVRSVCVFPMVLSLLAIGFEGNADEPEWWSLKPIAEVSVPRDDHDSWSRSDLDRFIYREWRRADLEPGPEASPEVLARRVYFNLVGLPPDPAELDQFLVQYEADPETAMASLVNRLLASPHFGEKWARHWLDLARYAESNGKDRDVVFPHAWRYRDYVIDAFNADKPIDDFFREQIAGDLVNEAADESRIATAFLALGPKAFQEVSAEKFRLDVVDEQIDVMTRSMLGLTVACARCHDHKFDPIPTRDYYAMAGVLLSSDTRYGPGPLYFGNHDKDTELVPLGDRAAERHPVVQQWRTEILETTEKVTGLRSGAYRIQRDIAGALRERGLKKAGEAADLAEKEATMLSMRAEADELNQKRISLIASPPPDQPGYTMAVLASETAPEDCAVRLRGIHDDHGERVPRGQLTIPGIPPLDEVEDGESGRLQLANWIASDRNPLTARVFVNRVWHHLFGTGLVATVDNFGTMGESPSHPELLDHLATEFMADGWRVKPLVRRILLSRTWQLSSRDDPAKASVDPANRLLWRANFRRLEFEAFRDSVLAVSGQLELSPRQGSLFQEVYAGKDYGEPSENRANFDPEIAADRHRTVYLPIARNHLPEMLVLFDFADPTAPIGARNSRTIPAQALYLMNNPFIEGQSRAAAERILSLPPEERMTTAWRLATGRLLASDTRAAMDRWIAQGEGEDPEAELEAWTDLMQSLFASVPFRYLE